MFLTLVELHLKSWMYQKTCAAYMFLNITAMIQWSFFTTKLGLSPFVSTVPMKKLLTRLLDVIQLRGLFKQGTHKKKVKESNVLVHYVLCVLCVLFCALAVYVVLLYCLCIMYQILLCIVQHLTSDLRDPRLYRQPTYIFQEVVDAKL